MSASRLARYIASVDALLNASNIDPVAFLESTPSDIRMLVDDIGDREKQVTVKYELSTKRISLYGYGLLAESKYWNSSGKIVSVLDLPGTQLITSGGHFVPSRC
jgi:hypothetical protein